MRNATRTFTLASSLFAALALPAHAAGNNCDTTIPTVAGAAIGWVGLGLLGGIAGGVGGNQLAKTSCPQPPKGPATKTKSVAKPWVNPDTIKKR